MRKKREQEKEAAAAAAAAAAVATAAPGATGGAASASAAAAPANPPTQTNGTERGTRGRAPPPGISPSIACQVYASGMSAAARQKAMGSPNGRAATALGFFKVLSEAKQAK